MNLRTAGFGIAALLALTACSASGSPAEQSTPGPTPVAVTLRDFKIDIAATTVPASVQFGVRSDGPTPHSFGVRDSSGQVVLLSRDLRATESDVVTGQLTRGEYTFFCAFPGHESLGMHGTFTVQ